MDSLDGTDWDIIIAGTGLQESLLALALSRSNQSILHVDKNDYYGGPESALSLQDAQQWARDINSPLNNSYFANAKIISSTVDPEKAIPESTSPATLSFSRAYSLSLSPHILYSRSGLLPALVSAKVDSQLDFLILGSWWVYSESFDHSGAGNASLARVPSGREDLFADQGLDVRTKRALTKFLRFIADLENQEEILSQFGTMPFSEFLEAHFKLKYSVQLPIHALAMSSMPPDRTTTAFAVPRVARHLRSIGLFGPGFGAVIPKWGGLAEVTQVACRACAVGGAVYNLGNGVKSFGRSSVANTSGLDDTVARSITVELQDGSRVGCDRLVMAEDNMPLSLQASEQESGPMESDATVVRAVYIISSDLSYLFPPVQEGANRPAGAVVLFPASALVKGSNESPVHIIAHNSETGECPVGQSILYANALEDGHGFEKIELAIKLLLASVEESPSPSILWEMHYQQRWDKSHKLDRTSIPEELARRVSSFPPPSLDITFDDGILEHVKTLWCELTGASPDTFLQFRPRDALGEEAE